MKAKIIGYGVSGKAAESFLESRKIETVVVADDKETVLDKFDFCVVSPGISSETVKDYDIPVVPEVELPFYIDKSIKPNKIIAVTGTNGKTTIVNQINSMILDAGGNAVLCGNVGIPVSQVADKLNNSIAVIEVSSFMLEQTKLLHPNIAVITNITSDHLDRHKTMEEYIRCKKKIVANQNKKDVLIINWDDKNARLVGTEIEGKKNQKVIWYSNTTRVNGYFVDKGYVCETCWYGYKKLFSVNDIGGMPHSVSNALVTIAVGRLLKLNLKHIIHACRHKEQKNRIELVADKNGIVFYNDSKATNIASTIAAIKSFTLPICLIICGKSKGQDYNELLLNLPENVKHIIVFGECKPQILQIAEVIGLTNIYAVNNLEEAINKSLEVSTKPSVVLFSPAGSSFDQFKNYEDRGNKFCEIVKKIILQ